MLTNTKIGELFGVSYSSISHIVTSVQSVLERAIMDSGTLLDSGTSWIVGRSFKIQ